MLNKYLAYLRDNPNGYWFKRKLFGWGWVPVKWQGWAVILFAIAIALGGGYIGEKYDAPGAVLLAVLLTVIIIFVFGYWKGQKPRWQWGFPKDEDSV